MLKSAFFGLWTFSIAAGLAAAQEWPQWRGPNGNGLGEAGGLPSEWGADKNLAWKVELPGEGWSSPIVWGDKIFVTVAIKEGGSNEELNGEAGDSPQGARPSGDRPGGPPGGDRPGGGPPGGGAPGSPGRGGPPGQGGRPGGMGNQEPPAENYKLEVLCLDRNTGKTLWSQVAREGKLLIAKHSDNTYATETPITDGERVYAYFGMHGVYCYDLSGKLLWKKDLGTYKMEMGFGTASSPAFHAGMLFIQVDNDEKSFLAALDAKTGDEKWRVERDEKTNWGSPIIWKNKVRPELVAPGAKTRSYDPATGKLLWELDMKGGRWSASPTATEDLLILANEARGRGETAGGRMYAVKPGGTGDVSLQGTDTSNAFVAWMVPEAGSPSASPLIYKGYVYVFERRGAMVSCYDAQTGKPAYQKQRLEGARAFWASPWAYEDKIFCLDDAGTTIILAPGPEFKVLGQNKLDGQFWSTPSFARGSLLLRAVEGLYCFKK